MMHEEFKKIMEFFSLDPQQKAEHLEDVFKNSIEFFEKFKHILESGTPEEKSAIMQEVMQLQEKLQKEMERMSHDTGLSEDQLKDFAHNKENFNEEEWKAIEAARAKLEKQAEALSSVLPQKPEPTSPQPAKSKEPKKPATKKKWMKS